MNRFQLYELVKPILPQLDLNNPLTLCNVSLYNTLGTCFTCPFSCSSARRHCNLYLLNKTAQQLKADIILKHPELLI